MKINKLNLNIEVAKKLGVFRGVVGDWMPDGVMFSMPGESFFHTERDFTKPADGWMVIELIWDDLMSDNATCQCCEGVETVWEVLIEEHKCSKIEAALILYSGYEGEQS